MKRHIYRVKSFKIAGPFTLAIAFDDGTERTVDFSTVLHGEIYGPLREPRIFKTVTLDPEIGTLVWSNGADFDPAILHDWPECGPELSAKAQHWTEVETRISAVAEGKAKYVTGKAKNK